MERRGSKVWHRTAPMGSFGLGRARPLDRRRTPHTRRCGALRDRRAPQLRVRRRHQHRRGGATRHRRGARVDWPWRLFDRCMAVRQARRRGVDRIEKEKLMMQAAGPVVGEDRFEGTDGYRLFYRTWRPDGPARGVVVIVPGFNGHSGYYPWTAQHLAGSGFPAYPLDLRGPGRSAGEHFYVLNV